MDNGIEFMATMIGLLALLCIFVIVFGLRGTRKLLAWTAGLAVLGYAAMIVWVLETQGPDHWWNAPIIRSAFQQLGWCATPVPQAIQPAAAPAVAIWKDSDPSDPMYSEGPRSSNPPATKPPADDSKATEDDNGS